MDDVEDPQPAPEAGAKKKVFPKPVAAVFYFFGFMTLGAFYWFVVPGFVEVFSQVKVALPGVTLMIIRTSDIACRFPAAWIGMCAFLSVALAYVIPSRRWANTLFLLLIVVSLGMLVAGLFLPLLTIWEGITGR